MNRNTDRKVPARQVNSRTTATWCSPGPHLRNSVTAAVVCRDSINGSADVEPGQRSTMARINATPTQPVIAVP